MKTTHVVGIDPGLVHTGAVRLVFKHEARSLVIDHEALLGDDANKVAAWADGSGIHPSLYSKPHIFIEGYRQRSSFNTDKRMIEAVSEMRVATKGTVLDNTGVKKVVKRELMDLLGVWKFSTPTHHQDLRSAARIALYGMLKDDDLNAVVTGVLVDHLNGRPWYIHHI